MPDAVRTGADAAGAAPVPGAALIPGVAPVLGTMQVPTNFDPPRLKTKLDFWTQLAQTIGGFATPIVLGALTLWGTVFGGWSQRQTTIETQRANLESKREDTRAKILDAAIAILKAPPDKDRPEIDSAARNWAVHVVNEYKVIGTSTPAFLPSVKQLAAAAPGAPGPPTPPLK